MAARVPAIPARDTFFTLADQGAVSAGNFLTGILIGRYCSKGELGVYLLGFSLVIFLIDVQVSLISTPYAVFSPRLTKEALRGYNGSTMLQQFVLTALAVATLLLGSCAFSLLFGTSPLTGVLSTLAVSVWFLLLREFIRRVCFVWGRFDAAFYFDSSIALLQLVGLMTLVALNSLSAERAFLVTGLASGVAGVNWLGRNRSRFLFTMSEAVSDCRKNWTFSKWVFLSGLLWSISANAYPWLLSLFHGPASVGVWGACWGAIALANVPLAGAQNLIGPSIMNICARKGIAEMRDYVGRSCALVFCATCIFTAILWWYGESIVVSLYGDKYSGNGDVVTLQMVGVMAASMAFSHSRGLFAIDRPDVDFKINFLPLGLLLTLGVFLCARYGPTGAASALVLANTAALLVRWGIFINLCRSAMVGATR